MLDPFEQRRSQVLQGLESQEVDKSRAGGVDARIQGLVDCMNQHLDLYTTSSCSGRISVFAEPSAATKAAGKKGGEWVYATHDLADGQDVLKCIQERMVTGSKLIFRFEPFILAAECRDMGSAQKLVAVARQAGFRESGVTATKARTIAGIRCSLRLEVPVADQGRLLVEPAYLQKYLVDFGNEKMEANWVRTARLHHLFKDQLLPQQESPSSSSAQQPCHEKRSKAGGSKQLRRALAPTHQTHLSEFAVQQLSQTGVSAQLLQQLQTAPRTDLQTYSQTHSQSALHVPRQGSPDVRRPGQKAKPKRQAKAKGDSMWSGSSTGIAQRAQSLKAWQEAILGRLSTLEVNQAHSSQTHAGNIASGRGLAWENVKPTMQEVEASALNRWGHTTALYGKELVVFGGYGGTGAHSRTADVLVYDCTTNVLSAPSIQGSCPPARMGHSAVLVGHSLVIFGGRMSPAQPLGDVWALDLLTHTWQCIACKGNPPAARYRHTAVALASQAKTGSMFIHGGYDGQNTFGDTYVLTTSDWTWRQAVTTAIGVQATGESRGAWHCIHNKGHAPEPCHSHAATALQGRMFVFGGTRGYSQQACPGLYILDLKSLVWEAARLPVAAPQAAPHAATQAAPQASPTPCFSHSLTAVGGLLVLAGGCHTLGSDHIHMYAPSQKQWSRHSVANSSELVLCRHTATLLPDHRSIFFLGGGMNCFGFGTTFSPPLVLDVTSLVDQNRFSASADAAARQVSDGTAHGQSLYQTLDYSDVAAHQASDSTVCKQNRILATDAAAAQQASDDTSHGQNPNKNLLSGALPEAKGLEPSAVSYAVIGVKATPSPTGGTRGEYLQGGAGRGGPKAAASLTSGSHPQGEQLSQQAACIGDGHAQEQELSKALAVARLQAKAAKDALKGLGWLDRSCRADADSSSGVICLPLTDSGSTMLQSAAFSAAQSESNPATSAQPSFPQLSSAQPSSAQPSSAQLSSAQRSTTAQLNHANAGSVQDSSSCSALSMASSQPLPTRELPVTNGSLARLKGSTVSKGRKRHAVGSQEANMACLQALMQAGLANVQPIATSKSSRVEGGPAQRLKGAVTTLLQQQGLAQERIAQLLLELPSRWEKLGDLALLPRTCMASPEWGCLGQPLWEAVACALRIKRLAMQAPVANAGTRDSQAQLVLGGSGWVHHKEGGVLYSLDVTKCMFSSGNTTERQRMGRLQCAGETVVDLYAGIGYYTLPFLCKAGAASVIACEWNPNALQALRKNLELNGVAARCQIMEGDCRLTAPRGVADRVSLGLLPSSQGGWQTALEALKSDLGGWLHLHHNVADTAEAEWCQQTVAALQLLADNVLGRSWICRLDHCERVKWYAPHVRHLVLDIHVQPSR